MSLECRGLTKRFGRKIAVNDVSLKIDDGDVLGLIGPNGAGKSTMLKLFTGLIWPTAGSVKVCGHDVHREHSKAMANIGAIIEWPSFHPYLTARRNLDIFSGGYGKEYEQKLKEITHFVEIESWLDEKVGSFSTGMKQRLGIALALLPNSRFIILDEPTNGLDPGGIIEIRTIVKEYNKRFGTTILITSHLLGEIENVCSRIAIINQGRIVSFGSLEEILERESCIRIITEDNVAAIPVLENGKANGRLSFESCEAGKEEILVNCPIDMASDLNDYLVGEGVRIKHLSVKRKDLESYFMETTNNGKTSC